MSGRIVIVDDVEDNCIILSRNLTRAGFETQTLTDGVSAHLDGFDLTAGPHPPRLDDAEALGSRCSPRGARALRRQQPAGDHVHGPRRGELDRRGASRPGANDYIQKPINMPIVIARVSAQLERRAALQALGRSQPRSRGNPRAAHAGADGARRAREQSGRRTHQRAQRDPAALGVAPHRECRRRHAASRNLRRLDRHRRAAAGRVLSQAGFGGAFRAPP